MRKYRYDTYSEIPGNIQSFIENVSGQRLLSLTITEINDFLNDTDDWYEKQNLSIEDFVI